MNLEVKKNKRLCINTNCFKRANFNFTGEKKGLYCTYHKKDGMVNVITPLCSEQYKALF